MSESEQGVSPETLRWLAERLRPGNWFSIARDEVLPADVQMYERTILHMFQVCFGPEIERRITDGRLGDDFVLQMAQLVQPEDGPSFVRLNNEVRGIGVLKTTRPVGIGAPVYESDMVGIMFDLDESELNSGHMTLLWTGNGWSLSFDLRPGRARCLEIIDVAAEFLNTAIYALKNQHHRAAIDNLFSACELLSKVRLVLSHSLKQGAENHKAVASGINRERKLGNVDPVFVDIFNRVANARRDARYRLGQIEPLSEADVAIVGSVAEQLRASILPIAKRHTG
jgi:hypothetical protein